MRQNSFCDGCFWVETNTEETLQKVSLCSFFLICLFRHQIHALSHNVCDISLFCNTLTLSTVLNIIIIVIVDVNKTEIELIIYKKSTTNKKSRYQNVNKLELDLCEAKQMYSEKKKKNEKEEEEEQEKRRKKDRRKKLLPVNLI